MSIRHRKHDRPKSKTLDFLSKSVPTIFFLENGSSFSSLFLQLLRGKYYIATSEVHKQTHPFSKSAADHRVSAAAPSLLSSPDFHTSLLARAQSTLHTKTRVILLSQFAEAVVTNWYQWGVPYGNRMPALADPPPHFSVEIINLEIHV